MSIFLSFNKPVALYNYSDLSSELSEQLEQMRLKLLEKKARDADSGKGESSIAVNGFLLCKGRFREISTEI